MIDAAEVERVRRMAEGETPFKSSGLLERLRQLDTATKLRLPPAAREAVALYEGARRRVESLKEVA
jgi:hypothetical protein